MNILAGLDTLFAVVDAGTMRRNIGRLQNRTDRLAVTART
ncbi:hypothetical protein M878_02600 [Streptomyces roseochromogenus subsp. oscitans DS 12.976]|uniref:Uncharacterized protein n=1 Tax=Streptomyces roseochromogenus subsp. oscitans DS 12.976 TaxID=1352936 RepID=V6KXY4_STRRC|nr:hypothetical protein M878_02600 [Streptomyces roseochromogenus subsp. oscitans DS 12.976]